MAKTRRRRLWVDPPAADQGVTSTRWYYGQPGDDLAAQVDAAQDQADLPPFFETTVPEIIIGIQGATDMSEGQYQFVQTHVDAAGNESTPYQHPAWADVTIDVTPPDPGTGGGIEIV
jgi:hypothetical protein